MRRVVPGDAVKAIWPVKCRWLDLEHRNGLRVQGPIIDSDIPIGA